MDNNCDNYWPSASVSFSVLMKMYFVLEAASIWRGHASHLPCLYCRLGMIKHKYSCMHYKSYYNVYKKLLKLGFMVYYFGVMNWTLSTSLLNQMKYLDIR